jgi:hypothetical protein
LSKAVTANSLSITLGTPIGGHTTIKMMCRKSKTQFVKQERKTQNAIALLNCLAHCAVTINAKNASFSKNFKAQRTQAQLH